MNQTKNNMRRKLFSDNTPIRRKLFSSIPKRKLFCDEIILCKDCGKQIGNNSEICPNCGSSQVIESGTVETPEEVINLNLDMPSSNIDDLLKEYSDQTLSIENLQELLNERGIVESVEDLINSGDVQDLGDGNIYFTHRADVTRKLFSKIVISITKELELDPIESKEEAIQRLSEKLNPKSIVFLRKAHNLPSQLEFSEDSSYIKDSGIENDLKLEHGGQTLPLDEFKKIIEEQYDDAPETLLDDLQNANIIKIFGSQVEIIK